MVQGDARAPERVENLVAGFEDELRQVLRRFFRT
jgi:hypothetical protein